MSVYMKTLLLLTLSFLSLGLSAQTASRMQDLTAEQKADAKDINLTGTLSTKGNSDFRQLRDLCWQLQKVDLGMADCPAVPNNAFHSRRKLQTVVLP